MSADNRQSPGSPPASITLEPPIQGRIECSQEGNLKLKIAEERLRFLVSVTPGILFACAPEPPFNISFVTENVEAIFGYPHREWIETPGFWPSHVHPDDVPRLRAMDPALYETGRLSCEYRFRHQDGSYRWLQAEVRLLRDAEGRPVELTGVGLDITERKRAEVQLQLQASLLDQIHDTVTATDLEGRITYVNEEQCRLLGRSRQELLGQFVSVYGDDPEQGATQQQIIEATRTHGTWRGEVVNRDREGRTFTMDCRTILVRDEHDQPIGMCGTGTDITERKQAEEALRESERRLRMALEGARMATWDVDFQTGRVILSENGESFFGLKPGAFAGTVEAFFALAHPDDRPRLQTDFVRNAQEGANYESEFRITWPDGSVRWLRVLGRCHARISGHPARMSGVGFDITERKRAEQALRDSEQRFQVLAAATFEGIAVTENARFIDANERLAKMLGYRIEELVGLKVADTVAPEDRERVLANIHAERESSLEHEMVRKDGSRLIVEAHGRTVVHQGRHVRFTAIRDLTGRRQSEEALQSLSRRLLEVHETERRALARELHDEVGQSLTLLKLTLDQCLSIDRALAPGQLDKARSILLDLVQRVRNMSLDLRPSMLDDLGLLPALLWQFDRYTSQTGIRVTFSQIGLDGRRLGPHVETAAFRIVQEALTNAARHASVRKVSVHLSAEARQLRVQVQDHGCGFDVETALASGKSSGLRGMAERVRLLGGKLQINSDPSAGTFVTAELPLGDLGPAGEAIPPQEAPLLPGENRPT